MKVILKPMYSIITRPHCFYYFMSVSKRFKDRLQIQTVLKLFETLMKWSKPFKNARESFLKTIRKDEQLGTQ